MINKIIKKIYAFGGDTLTNGDDIDYEIRNENGIFKVYAYDGDDYNIELSDDECWDVFLPFVFNCIDKIIWKEVV